MSTTWKLKSVICIKILWDKLYIWILQRIILPLTICSNIYQTFKMHWNIKSDFRISVISFPHSTSLLPKYMTMFSIDSLLSFTSGGQMAMTWCYHVSTVLLGVSILPQKITCHLDFVFDGSSVRWWAVIRVIAHLELGRSGEWHLTWLFYRVTGPVEVCDCGTRHLSELWYHAQEGGCWFRSETPIMNIMLIIIIRAL